MNLEIITPEKRLFDGEVQSIKVPGRLGEFQVLKDHATIVSTLGEGPVTLKEPDGKITVININGGVVEVHKNKIILLLEEVKGERP